MANINIDNIYSNSKICPHWIPVYISYMGQTSSTIALEEAERNCSTLKDLFQQCADKFEKEQQRKNGGREGYQNLGGFASSPCQILFDDYKDCISEHMLAHVKSLKK